MPDGAEVITVTLADKTFRAGRRTAAHLEHTIAEIRDRLPDCRLHIIQPCYNTDVAASEGTHDKDGVLDVQIIGLDWLPAQRFLRELGWAAWFRFPPTFSQHIHMISLGCPGPLGEFVPGQILDYYNHALGLAGQHDPGSDKTWFPDDIDSTIFDWEATMPLNDADKAWISSQLDAAVDAAVRGVMQSPINNKGTKFKAAIEAIYRNVTTLANK